MRKYRVTASTNIVGSETEEEFEIDDDATEEEIEKMAFEVAIEMLDWCFEEIK